MTVDDYIAGFPKPVQKKLQDIRRTIRRAVPDAEETIKYQIPTYVVNGRNAISFAAYKKHIGVYPIPGDDPELEPYRTAKSTARFPLDEPLPLALIERIAKHNAKR